MTIERILILYNCQKLDAHSCVNEVSEMTDKILMIKRLILVILYFSATVGLAENGKDQWTLTTSQLDQKIWTENSGEGIAVAKHKSVSSQFKLKTYLAHQKKYKRKALDLLGARHWSVVKKKRRENSVFLRGHYTDRKGRTVQFVEYVKLKPGNKTLKTVVITKTSSSKKLKIKDYKKKIKSFLDAL